MQNSVNHRYHNKKQEEQSHSQCPQCGNRYSSSQSNSEGSEQESQQRIMIPLHKDLFQQNQGAFSETLKNLQKQVDNLKSMNHDKDRMIDDMKKQMDHKMTHYMLYGQLKKHNDQINKIRGDIDRNQQISRLKTQFREVQTDRLPRRKHKTHMDEDESANEYLKRAHERKDVSIDSFGKDFNLKSTYNINPNNRKTKQKEHQRSASENPLFIGKISTQKTPIFERTDNEYYESSKVPIFKIGEAKKRICYLEDVVRRYEEEILWLHNFANVFVKGITGLADQKYGEKIMMGRWNLKKKVKMSWRYLKHLLAYLYSGPS